MALLVECPKCKTRNSLKSNTCSCGFGLKKHSSKIYWIDYRVNGKRKRERIGRSKLAAENRLRQVETQTLEERYIEKDKNASQNLDSIINWYLALPEVNELSSYTRIRESLCNINRIMGKETIVKHISLAGIQNYRKSRGQEESRKYPGRKITVATMNREVTTIKTALNRAVTYEKISSNPIKDAPILKEENIRERVLSDQEFERLLAAAPEHIKPILIVAFHEPMRFEEIILLKWDEVDLKSEPGFIRLVAKRTKGKKEGRLIPLHPRVRKTLEKLPSRFTRSRVFQNNGKSFDTFRKSFKKAKEDAGIEDFMFHDFRHCAITNLRRAGNDIPTIMKISGHKTLSMFQRYNLVDESDVAKVSWKTSVPDEGKSKKNVQ
ncbi:site-specific integrase [bacterium]|nr:site-specific integrase [bacterium]